MSTQGSGSVVRATASRACVRVGLVGERVLWDRVRVRRWEKVPVPPNTPNVTPKTPYIKIITPKKKKKKI